MTEPITLTGPELDELPGLDQFLDAPRWRLVFARLCQSLLDPHTDPDAPRKIKLEVGFRPEADLASCVASVKKFALTAPGPRLGHGKRLSMGRAQKKLQVHVMQPQQAEELPVAAAPRLHTGTLPHFNELWDGALDAAWRRALVRVMLSIDDPRADVTAERKIQVEIVATTDAERAVMRIKLAKVQPVIAPAAKVNPAVLYFNPLDEDSVVLEWEPVAHLPGGAGYQDTVPGTVVNFNRRTS